MERCVRAGRRGVARKFFIGLISVGFFRLKKAGCGFDGLESRSHVAVRFFDLVWVRDIFLHAE
jgi:hypothetical protein